MKKANKIRSDVNNHEIQEPDDRQLDRTIAALQNEPPASDPADAELSWFTQLGSDLKRIAELDLPDNNPLLKQDILDQLAAQQSAIPAKPVKSKIARPGLLPARLALAASLLLAIGVSFWLIQHEFQDSAQEINLQGGVSMKIEQPGFDKDLQQTPAAESSKDAASEFGLTSKKLAGPDDGKSNVSGEGTSSAGQPFSGNPNQESVQQGLGLQASIANGVAVEGNLPNRVGGKDGEFDSKSRSYGLGGNAGGLGGGGFGGGGLGGGGRGAGDIDGQGRFVTRRQQKHTIQAPPVFFSYDDAGYLPYPESRKQFSGEQYAPVIENEFVAAKGNQALSTFSIDVDTASYSNIRRFLTRGQMPPQNAIRIEEMINYFQYDYDQPTNGDPFAVNMELAHCPWNDGHQLLRVAIQGKETQRQNRLPSNLVFLLDVSGSMQSVDKLPLLKKGLSLLIRQLGESDTVSIVTYAGNAGVVLQPTNGANSLAIENAIAKLTANGSTNGSAGIELAYQLAQQQFIKDGNNRVIMATDGDLNVGLTDDQSLVTLIKEKASEGVFLTMLGFGTGNLKDSKLEKLADNGNGLYAYIDSYREAHRVLVQQMSGSLETIAKDVKLQIEFNPAEVAAYRLIGYENRVLATKDFDNDRKDAGEIGAGHTVTAFYELVPVAQTPNPSAAQTQLKYQKSEPRESEQTKRAAAADEEHSGELLTLSIRFKQPNASQSVKRQFVLETAPVSFTAASSDFQFSTAVAAFGMILRQSEHRGTCSLAWVVEIAMQNVGDDIAGYRAEFVDLVRQAKNLIR